MLATWAPRQPKMAWSGSPTTKTLPCSQAATALFKLSCMAWAAWSPREWSKCCVTWTTASTEGCGGADLFLVQENGGAAGCLS